MGGGGGGGGAEGSGGGGGAEKEAGSLEGGMEASTTTTTRRRSRGLMAGNVVSRVWNVCLSLSTCTGEMTWDRSNGKEKQPQARKK